MKLSAKSLWGIIQEEEKALGREIAGDFDCSDRLIKHLEDTIKPDGYMDTAKRQGWANFRAYVKSIA